MSNDFIDRLRKLAVATLSDGCDQIAGRRGFMDFEIKARINGRKIVEKEFSIERFNRDVVSFVTKILQK